LIKHEITLAPHNPQKKQSSRINSKKTGLVWDTQREHGRQKAAYTGQAAQSMRKAPGC
jgi:hypothetical protein